MESFENLWKHVQEKMQVMSTPSSSAPATRSGSATLAGVAEEDEDHDPYIIQPKTLEQRRDEQELRELEREREQEKEQEKNQNKKKNPFLFHKEESSYRDPYEDDNDFSMGRNNVNVNQVNNNQNVRNGRESSSSKIFNSNPFLEISKNNNDRDIAGRQTSVPSLAPASASASIPPTQSNPFRKNN